MHFLKIWNCPSKTRMTRVIYPKKLSEPNMWLLVNHTKLSNILHWNQYLLTAGNYKSATVQLQNRGQLQNNTINGAVVITINCVIRSEIWRRSLRLQFCWSILSQNQTIYLLFVVLCAILYHLYNLKNVKNTHGGVLLLVM